MIATSDIGTQLHEEVSSAIVATQQTRDGIPTFWLARDRVGDVMRHLKTGVEQPYAMLYDLTAIDERMRKHREGEPASDFTVVYHLLSFERNAYLRLKVALSAGDLHILIKSHKNR